MKKTLRISLITMLLTMFCGMTQAAVVTDELTWDGLGLNGSNSQYADFADKSFTSSAVYAGQASSGTGKYIQLRTNNNNAGIITTVSGGKLKSVTIAFNSSTTDRAISVYAKNEPYSAATDLYDETKAGTKLGDIAANDDSKTLTVEGDYTYIGLRSKSGAIYIDKIIIEWESDGQVQTVTKAPTFTPNGGTFFGSIDVDIDQEDGAKIYYSTNDGETWTLFTTSITLTETTTVQAYAEDQTKDVTKSNIVTKVFTKGSVCNTIAEFVALTSGTEAKLMFRAEDKVQVLLSNTNGNSNYVVLQDANNSRIVLYNTGAAANLVAGDLITGSLIGKYSPYNGMEEMAKTSNTDVSTIAVSGNAALTPEQLGSVAVALDASKFLALVKLSGLTWRHDDDANRNYASDGSNEIEVRDNFKVGYTLPELAEGQTMTITGIIVPYIKNDVTVYQITPISQEAIVVSDPSGISTVAADATQGAAIFNLAGQRVAAPRHGLFIVNGRKVVQ